MRDAPRPPARSRAAPTLAGAALAALGTVLAGACAALEIEVLPPRAGGGYVWSEIRLGEAISPRVEESLSRGMPATLQYHAELWRRRAGWFHRLESSFDVAIKIRYGVWDGLYRIERRGLPPLLAASLDSVRMVLARPVSLPVARATLLRPGASYYVVVAARLRPLSVEDIEEGEGWLSGEVENKRRAGLGVITAIPRSLFDAMRNFAGFGDESARAISDDFTLESLSAAP